MLRFIIRLIIYSIAIGFSIYIGVQWKLQGDIQDLTKRVFGNEVILDYQKAYLTLSGKAVITDVSLFFKGHDINITANEINYSMGNIFDMAFQDRRFSQGRLPDKLQLNFNELMLHLNPALVKAIARNESHSLWRELSASACGDLTKFGINQYFSMGYDYIVVNGELSFFKDSYNDQLQIEGWADIEETARISYQINLDNYQEPRWLINPDLSNIRMLLLDVTDKGFNRHKADYCASQSGISNKTFLQQHVTLVAQKLAEADLDLTPEAISAYTNVIQPFSQLNILLDPEESFSNKDFFYFSESELRRLSGFKIEINHQPLDKIFQDWSIEKYKNIQIKSNRRKKTSDDPVNKRYETLIIKRSFHPEELANIEKFMDYRVKLIRDDEKVYLGRLKRINKNRIYIVKPIQGGEVEVSVDRSRVKAFYIYR